MSNMELLGIIIFAVIVYICNKRSSGESSRSSGNKDYDIDDIFPYHGPDPTDDFDDGD